MMPNKPCDSRTLKIINEECQSWEHMNWNETESVSPIDNEKDVMTQLAEDGDPLQVRDLEATRENEGQQPGNISFDPLFFFFLFIV